MKISKEYQNQKEWRNWGAYIEKLPLLPSDSILDIGCGTGDLSYLLSQHAERITAIDRVEELIRFANKYNTASNIEYIHGSLEDLIGMRKEKFDGIWSSFSIAYFTEIEMTLKSWSDLLKKDGWIAIVEVNDMFAHEPMSPKSQKLINSYYQRQKGNGTYDFLAGSKLSSALEKVGFEIVHDLRMNDPELVFKGVAPPEIIDTWKNRLNRMVELQNFLGPNNFENLKDELINSFKSLEHNCNAEIVFLMARKRADLI